MDNNWSIEQTKKLFAYVLEASKSGRGLVFAFAKMAEETGKSVNSVRNYYYSQLKMFELVPTLARDLKITLISTQRDKFDMFTSDEITKLIQTVLVQKGQGKSVRAVIAEISGGDTKLALRLQNKYRSMITHHKDRVTGIMNDMSSRGLDYFNPYSKQLVAKGTPTNNYQKLAEYVSTLDEKEVDSFFSLIKKLFA